MVPLLLALTIAAPAAKDVKKDPPSIVGTWVMETASIGGRAEKPPGEDTRVTFHKDGKTTATNGAGRPDEEGSYTLDAKASPAQLDLIPNAKSAEMKVQGIYKIEGDTLTIAFTMDMARPATFESPAGSQVILLTLKRVKKD